MTGRDGPAAGPALPPLVHGEVSLDTFRVEIHISDDCPNAPIIMWRDAHTAPPGTTVAALVEHILRQDLLDDGEGSVTIRVCRCTFTGRPEPREAE